VSDGVEVKSGFDHSKFSPTPTQIDDDRQYNNTAPEIRYDTLCCSIHMYAYSEYRFRFDSNVIHSIYCIHNLQKHGEGKVAYMILSRDSLL
jgi:hypothetical protein